MHDKLNGLVIRAPIAGKVSAIDLKVGEIRSSGQRLAEVTPQTGMKLNADIDEFYLTRVRVGQIATITVNGEPVPLTIKRVYPQVQNGQFRVDLDFQGASPPSLVRVQFPRPLAARRRWASDHPRYWALPGTHRRGLDICFPTRERHC